MNIKRIKSKFSELYYGYDENMYSSLRKLNYISSNEKNGYRVNLVVPNLCPEKYFGGVATAFRFVKNLATELNARIRVIGEEIFDVAEMPQLSDYVIKFADEENSEKYSACRYRDLENMKVLVEEKDIFVMTYWTTMYKYKTVFEFQQNAYGRGHEIIYLIQDFEPSFFKWSAYYLLAESTYKEKNIIAVFNTKGLMEYTNSLGYNNFVKQYFFEPQLNETMKEKLHQKNNTDRKNLLIVYGRPRNARNCFSLIVESLKQVVENSAEAQKWDFVSIGVKHRNWDLGKGKKLVSKGKLSLDNYCQILKEAKVGISLMCSPHPSYPPLEMAAFGVHTITNSFKDKDLEETCDNLIALDNITIERLTETIIEHIENYQELPAKYGKKFDRFTQKENVEFCDVIPDLCEYINRYRS